MIYEADRLQEPLPLREIHTPLFALHFIIDIKCGTKQHLKQMASYVGKIVCQYYANMEAKENGITTAIFETQLESDRTFRGHILFPEIIVDEQRHATLRTAILNELSTQQANFGTELTRLNPDNNFGVVVRQVDRR